MEQDKSILTDITNTSKKIKHYTQSIVQNVHHFYIYGDIEDDIERYSDLLNILKTGSELDTIFIYINSGGGCMRMAIQIVNAMFASDCKIITSLDGEAFSAATLIFLAGQEYIVNDNCSFMLHTYSGGMQGKGSEMITQIEYYEGYARKVFGKFYEKILTEEELEDVIGGKDKWLDSDELIERLERGKNDVNNEGLDNPKTNPLECHSAEHDEN